jgi:hypothetical protein
MALDEAVGFDWPNFDKLYDQLRGWTREFVIKESHTEVFTCSLQAPAPCTVRIYLR